MQISVLTAHGSPPRVRGTVIFTKVKAGWLGITPACAGNRGYCGAASATEEDHPRVCGEQQILIVKEQEQMGSPPRVRGTADLPPAALPHPGITPACAGNSHGPGWHLSERRDHPRVCGEQKAVAKTSSSVTGSPPRVRGTAGDPRGPVGRFGDHPRVCGEQEDVENVKITLSGSPPRVRGTEVEPVQVEAAQGITPACAGNSHPYSNCREKSQDHPRVCGEQARHHHYGSGRHGSPPRVRGTGAFPSLPQATARITPACAGNSAPLALAPGPWADHPRVCGEQRRLRLPVVCVKGSPPRVRGTDLDTLRCISFLGITPACAGNSV